MSSHCYITNQRVLCHCGQFYMLSNPIEQLGVNMMPTSYHTMKNYVMVPTSWQINLPDAECGIFQSNKVHYNDVVMSTMMSQITGVSIVCSIVGSGEDQRKHQSSASLAFVWRIHQWRWFPACNAENVSIWWRHHVNTLAHNALAPSVVRASTSVAFIT